MKISLSTTEKSSLSRQLDLLDGNFALVGEFGEVLEYHGGPVRARFSLPGRRR